MPVLCIFLLFGHHDYFVSIYRTDFVYRMYVIAGILTVALPILSFIVLYKWGIISDINLSKRKERILPTYIALIYYCSFYYLIRTINGIDPVILSAVFSCIVAITITNIITSYWKISIHTAGISLVTGIFVAATQVKQVNHIITIIVLFLLIGLVGSSRIYLKRHTPAQVYAGGTLGFIVAYMFVTNNVLI
jgi:membrane-associated phospholipid phosphatase